MHSNNYIIDRKQLVYSSCKVTFVLHEVLYTGYSAHVTTINVKLLVSDLI